MFSPRICIRTSTLLVAFGLVGFIVGRYAVQGLALADDKYADRAESAVRTLMKTLGPIARKGYQDLSLAECREHRDRILARINRPARTYDEAWLILQAGRLSNKLGDYEQARDLWRETAMNPAASGNDRLSAAQILYSIRHGGVDATLESIDIYLDTARNLDGTSLSRWGGGHVYRMSADPYVLRAPIERADILITGARLLSLDDPDRRDYLRRAVGHLDEYLEGRTGFPDNPLLPAVRAVLYRRATAYGFLGDESEVRRTIDWFMQNPNVNPKNAWESVAYVIEKSASALAESAGDRQPEADQFSRNRARAQAKIKFMRSYEGAVDLNDYYYTQFYQLLAMSLHDAGQNDDAVRIFDMLLAPHPPPVVERYLKEHPQVKANLLYWRDYSARAAQPEEMPVAPQ